MTCSWQVVYDIIQVGKLNPEAPGILSRLSHQVPKAHQLVFKPKAPGPLRKIIYALKEAPYPSHVLDELLAPHNI